MNRRSLLTRLAALFASVPLLRLRGEAKPTGPTKPTDLTLTDRYAAWLKAQVGDEQAGPFALADTYGQDEVRRCTHTVVWVRNDHGEIERHESWDETADIDAEKLMRVVRPMLRDTPPRDGGWM